MSIIPFQFESTSIRVVTGDNGEPLFVGKDVCTALGYANATDAMNAHCRGVGKRYPILDSLGRTQDARVLSEPDVLRLIVSSNLPAAQRFEAWIFEEVMPSIRKTGGYSVQIAEPASPLNQARLIAGDALKIADLFGVPTHLAQVESVKMVRQLSGVDLSSMLRLAPAQDNIADQDVWLEPAEIARRLGISRAKINPLLEQAGLQSKIYSEWVATDAGKKISSRHQWSVGPKSGYNLKWKFRAVEEVLKRLVSPNPAFRVSR